MASMMKKAMIYLGLGPDEEYEQYDEYAAPAPVGGPAAAAPSSRGAGLEAPAQPAPAAVRPRVDERPLVHPHRPGLTGTVRPINPAEAPAPAEEIAAVPDVRPIETPQRVPSVSSAVRTIGPASAMPHAVTPTSFNDAQEIGDRFKTGQPVIVNLQGVDRDLRRRLVDFASGLCYAIAGKMERVADQVYLLTPADVEVSPEETRRHLD